MSDPEASFDDGIVADMRAHGGKVTAGPLAGHPILIMMSTGARSGQARRALLTYSRDGDAFVVAGTAGGSKKDPAWLANLRATPTVTIDVDDRVVEATASVAEGADRDRLWERHVASLPHFAAYPEQTGRVIPMVRLTPAA